MPPITNYPDFNRKHRWLGIIDYRTLMILCGYMFFIYKITDFLHMSVINSMYTIIICSVPVLGLIYANRNEDDVYKTILVIFKFLISTKHYCYMLEKEVNYSNYENIVGIKLKKDKGKRILEKINKYMCDIIKI